MRWRLAGCFAASVLLLLNSIASAAKPVEHTFSFKLPAGADKPRSINVVGDFNEWNTSRNALREKDGVYTATLRMTPGVHLYKFLIDGTQWIEDPSADVKLEQPDGQGGNNSGVNVAETGDSPAAPTTPAAAPPVADAAAGHVFTYTPAAGDPKPTSVNVAGDFNGWNTTATPLTEKNGTFTATVKLTPGIHAYKFVLNGTDWTNDPTADAKLDQPDGQGGSNSGVTIADAATPPAATPPAATPAAKKPDATSADGHVFRYTPAAGDAKPTSVNVAGDFNGWNTSATQLTEKDGTFSVTVKLSTGVHLYKFVINGSDWKNDPNADKSLDQPDGQGGANSGVKISEIAPDMAPPVPPAQDKQVSSPTAGVRYEHEFQFVPGRDHATPDSVALVGDFNSWNRTADLMTFSDGAFRKVIPLAEGVHLYKLFIDGKWQNDPMSDTALEESDGYGGKNSAVLAGPDGRKMSPPMANAINLDALGHTPDDPHECDVIDTGHVRLGLRCQADDVQGANILFRKTDGAWARTPLYKTQSRVGIDRFAAVVTVPTPGQPLQYAFELIDGTATAYLASAGGVASIESAKNSAFTCDTHPSFETPEWAKHAVWYQIFPERFRNGDPKNDPDESPDDHLVRWTSRWYETQPGEKPGEENFYKGTGNVWKRRYGGDIQGIKQELPYLKSLGVNAIYLNPIFQAASMHKYDTTDYRHVDEHFGVKGDWPVAGETADPTTWKWSTSDKVFLDFLDEAHRQGFKVIIDGVFNHVGRPNPFFQDVLEHGKASPYADWFDIIDWGDPSNWRKMDDPYLVHGKPGGIQWMGWFGDKNSGLPIFKKNGDTGMGEGPTKLIDDITVRWLAPDGDTGRGVDGFRLDAANDVPHTFWKRWRELVKKTKPDAFIAGEIWDPAEAWINNGKEFDAVMNYQWAMPTVRFFVDTKNPTLPSVYARQLTDLCFRYPFQSSLAMMNLFDSHDTDRIASMFVNPNRGYDNGDRKQDEDGKDYDVRKPSDLERQRMKQAVALQMTFAGAPMIYYGDEAGMWSADDPSDRQPMVWKDLGAFADPEVKFDDDLFDWYRHCIAVRASRPELQTGFEHTLLADDEHNVLAISRDLDQHHSAIVINRSDSPHDVAIPFGPTDRNVDLVNELAKSKVVAAGDARPTVTGGTTVSSQHGLVRLTLRPWGTAVLSGDWN